EGIVNTAYYDKEELVAYLTSAIVEVQKNQEYDFKKDKVILDDYKNVKADEDDSKREKLKVENVDNDGKMKASEERHLAVNLLNKGMWWSVVIANIYFYESDSIKQYLDDGIVELFETKLGLSEDLGKDHFITKIVPILVFCDASIITTRSEHVLSYEISV